MPKPTRVMVDIETLGTDPGAAILSVGAVTFEEARVDDGDEDVTGFYREIELKSCEEAGLSVDADTLEWWLGQSADAKAVLTGGGDLREVLESFAIWYDVQDADELWTNSPSFDCRLLKAAFDAVGVDAPWEYYEERDFRTLKNLPGVDTDLPDTDDAVEHDAFDDAVVQARAASKILRQV